MTRERAKELAKWPNEIKAFAEGKAIQCAHFITGEWIDCECPEWDCEKYRIKPEPRLRPWRPEEVPVGALMRTKGASGNPWVILGITSRGTVQFPGDENKIHGDTFEQCLTLREWTSDRPGTSADKINWHPCGVQEIT